MADSRSLYLRDFPIFRLDKPGWSLFYTPGFVVVVNAAHVGAFEASLVSANIEGDSAAELYRRAAAIQNGWLEMCDHPFEPLCLTLYLNNECNLACDYCYSAAVSPTHTATRLALEVIQSAAAAVAANCAAQDRPFAVVFHGGGEPTLNQQHLETALNITEQAANQYNLKLFRYIATNGVMSEATATWLAGRFDQIGVSCDGPEEIQSRQRSLRTGRSSTPFVERTARVVRERGKALRIRVTITPYSVTRQDEIAEYICKKLKPQEIYVEPVYRGGRAGEQDSFLAEQAEDFLTGFLKARQVAHSYNIPWLFTGSRPAEIHGPYCNILRDVLNLVPEGLATACFKILDSKELRSRGLAIGQLNQSTGDFALDRTQIQSLRQRLRNEPARCKNCISRFHCVRSCPDQCLLEPPTNNQVAEFRCRVQKMMVESYLWECVEDLTIDNSAGTASKELAFGGASC